MPSWVATFLAPGTSNNSDLPEEKVTDLKIITVIYRTFLLFGDLQWCHRGFFSGVTDCTICPGVDSASKYEYQENSWE
jgi:hypothetical protein